MELCSKGTPIFLYLPREAGLFETIPKQIDDEFLDKKTRPNREIDFFAGKISKDQNAKGIPHGIRVRNEAR